MRFLKIVAIAIFIPTVISTFFLKNDFDSEIMYTPDHDMIGASFWNGRKSVKVDQVEKKIPYQLPGSLDSWAGGDIKSIIIQAPFAKATTFTINIVDSHDSSPPIFKILVEGKTIATIEVGKGAGKAPHEWKTKGKHSRYSFTVEEDNLSGPETQIVISAVSGSWSVIGSITAKIYPPVWRVEATLLGWGVLILLAFYIISKSFESMILWLQAHKLATAILLLTITFTSASYVYINKMLTSGVVSYHIIHGNDGYFLFRTAHKFVINRLPDGYTKEMALAALKDYVYLTAQPAGKDRGKAAYNLFMYGVAWCDQSAWIYLNLISPLKVRGYIAYLYNTKGVSPHTVSFVDTSKEDPNDDMAYIMAHARVTDTYNGVTFRNKRDGYASPNEICEQKFVPNRGSDIAKLLCQKPTIYGSNRSIIDSPAHDLWFYKIVFPLLPEFVLLKIAKFGIRHHPGMERGEKSYLMARMDHIFFNQADAQREYLKVEKVFEGTKWANLAKYYRLRLNQLSQCFPNNGYTGILPKQQAWKTVAYPDGREN